MLVAVVEPFLRDAHRTTWRVRGRSEGGSWLPFAEVVTAGPPEGHGSRLLVADTSARELAGGARLDFSCLSSR